MNLETLHYFQYIAKYKNITQAARHFYISQSTLSRHIMLLEKELNVTLFDRGNKQVELTEAGRVFADDCELFIKHMQNVIHRVKVAEQGSTGVLKLTTPGHLCPLIKESITRFSEQNPTVRLKVETYDFDEIASAIQYDFFHIGFTYDFAATMTEDLSQVPVGKDDFSLVVSSQLYPDLEQKDLQKIVSTLPLILPDYVEPPFMKSILSEIRQKTGVSNIEITSVNNTDSVMLLTSFGLGFGIVPTTLTMAKVGMESLSYLNLNDFAAKCTILMLYRPASLTSISSSFLRLIQQMKD